MTEAEEKESEVYKLDEIVVTATKSEKTIMDAPGSVDVITKDEINKRNIKDIDEAVRMIPGLYPESSRRLKILLLSL